MSSKSTPNRGVADDAARTRKLLDKNGPAKLSGIQKTRLDLQQGANQNIGTHAVLAIVMDQRTMQFTISAPIGVTDLEPNEWVINRTDDIPSMLVRKADPALGELNQARSHTKSRLCVEAKLLQCSQTADGKPVYFYPHRVDTSRNDLLKQAQDAAKEAVSAIKEELSEATDPAEKQRLNVLKAKRADPKQYLDEATATAENNIARFYAMPEVVEIVEYEHPQTFRTLTGPYGDTPQQAIYGSQGMTLDTVVNRIARHLMQDMRFDEPPEDSYESPVDEPPEDPDKSNEEKARVRSGSLLRRVLEKTRSMFVPPPVETKPPETGGSTKSLVLEEESTPAKTTSTPKPESGKGKKKGAKDNRAVASPGENQ